MIFRLGFIYGFACDGDPTQFLLSFLEFLKNVFPE